MSKSVPGYVAMIVRKWHIANEGSSFGEFKKQYRGRKWVGLITKEKFDYLATAPVKRPNQSKSQLRPRNKMRVYMPVWSVPKEEIGPEGLMAIKLFVKALADQNKAKFEVVEYAEPSVVEVREFTN